MRILRVLGSRLLPCGCFVGVYERYDGSTVEILDEVGPTCRDGHRPGQDPAAGAARPQAPAGSSNATGSRVAG